MISGNRDHQAWDPLRESTSSSDSESDVEDKDIIEARLVMVQKLKNQQEQPEEADPDLLLLQRDIYIPP